MKDTPFASIEKIILVTPMTNGSAAFEKATLSNYNQVVFEKGLFKLGDFCVFFKENSKLPNTSNFQVLKKDNFIVKRKIIEGDVSEGICFPITILPKDIKIELGADVSDILCITFFDGYKKHYAQKLINKIKQAFSDVTLGEDGISLRQAREIDDYGDPESVRHLDERNDWRKVTDDDLLKYQDSLCFFCDRNGKRFYLPAYMCLVLRHFIEEKELYFWTWSQLPPFNYGFDFRHLLSLRGTFKNLSRQQTIVLKEYIVFSLAKNAEEMEELFKIVETHSVQEITKVSAKYRLKFINKPNKIRKKK